MKIKEILDNFIFSKSGKLVAVNAVIEHCEQLPSTSSSSVNRRSVHTSVTRIIDKCRSLKKFKRPDAQKKLVILNAQAATQSGATWWT